MINDDVTPPHVKPRLKISPSIRELYWCDFPKDAQLPEFWKCRPVLVVSYRNTLHGAVTVIPCSTSDQAGNPWAVKLTTTIDDTFAGSWAICDKVTTIAVSRLSSHRNGKRRLPEPEFNQILACLFKWLPVIPLDKEPK